MPMGGNPSLLPHGLQSDSTGGQSGQMGSSGSRGQGGQGQSAGQGGQKPSYGGNYVNRW